MVFDEDQKRRDTDESMADGELGKDDRRSSAGRAAASAAAGGAGLGAGAAAGFVAGDDAVELIQEQLEDTAEASLSEIDAARARVAAAQDAARAAASFDVFESRVAGTGEELPAGITDAANIIGDALPPVPGGQDEGQQPDIDAPGGQPPPESPDPNDIVPVDGEAPEPGDAPFEGQEPAQAPGIEGGPAGEGDNAPPPPPSEAAPDFPAPPSAPSPPAPGGSFGEDEVVDEAPAPPAGPSASDPSDDGAAVAPPVAEAPAPAGPGVSDEAPSGPGFAEDIEPPIAGRPDVPDASSADGSSGVPGPPVAGESDAPSSPSAPDAPAAPGGSTEAPPAPGSPGSPSASGDQVPPPPGEPGASAPGGHAGQAVDYPYVYRWDDDGDWVDVAMQNDHGQVYYLRYYDDGSVYYLNEHGQYQQIEGDNLPRLLYVGDDGVAYFSKVQHHHNVYFSIDTHGNFEWVDYHDIPGYEPPVDDDYEYPRVAEYEYGDESWALVEMEDGRLIKYYSDGRAYLVDEHGNETSINGFQVPSLLYVDHDGDAYFRVFLENEGEYRYYTIDVDGGVEYIHPEDVPGYVEEEPVEDDYEPILPPNAPAYFEHNGETFPNPEHDDSFHFVGSPTPNTYRFENDEGYTIIIGRQPDGSYNILWGDLEANDQWDLGVNLHADGGYDILHYHGEHYEDGENYVPPVEDDVYDDLILPNGAPDYFEFGDRQYGNPLAQNYEQVNYDADTGTTTYRYLDEGEGDYNYVTVVYVGEGVYRVTYSDPDHPQAEMVFHVYAEDGYYANYQGIAGQYYDEYTEDHALQPDGAEYEPVLPEDAPPYFEFGGQQWDNPEQQGYDLYQVSGNLYTYRHPETGQYISINVLDDGTYYVNVQAPPGESDPFVINFHVQADGSYEAFDGAYYDEYMEQNPPVDEGEYPRIHQWDADENWAILEIHDGTYVKYYDYRPPHYVDEQGNDLEPYGAQNGRVIDVAENGEIYLRTGSSGSYNYYVIHPGGGYEQIDPHDIPGYEMPAEDVVYPRVTEWDADAGWAIIELEDGYRVKFYESGDEYYIDHQGNETPVTTYFGETTLLQIDEHGNAYVRTGSPENYSYILVDPDGGQVEVDPQDIPGYDYEEEGAEPDAEDAIFAAIPDNLPDYFEEERFPNPEGSENYHYHSSDGDVHYFVSEDGSSTIRVWTNPNGNVTMTWHAAPPGEINAASQELVVEIQANGDWETTYYSDGPPPQEEAPVFEADGYLPDGAPDYFGNEMWTNPETDERFEFQHEGNPERGIVTRTYQADLDGDGDYDYQIVVVEHGDGRVYLDYRNMETGETEARAEVQQDANGNYVSFGVQYYVQDPQGAAPYEEPVEEPVDDYLPDWLPASFDGWPSPVQEGFEYQYTGTGDGNQNHYYSNGQYTIMVTDYGDGTGRVLIDDLSNGQGWDTGYDLYDYGQYEVMDAYVPEQVEITYAQVEEVDPQMSVAPEDVIGDPPLEPEPVPDPAPVGQETVSEQMVGEEALEFTQTVEEASLTFEDPAIETVTEELAISEPQLEEVAEFQVAQVEVVEVEPDQVAQIPAGDEFVEDLDDIEDDGTGF